MQYTVLYWKLKYQQSYSLSRPYYMKKDLSLTSLLCPLLFSLARGNHSCMNGPILYFFAIKVYSIEC